MNKTHRDEERDQISPARSLHYNNVQGPILLINNGMIPIINSKWIHWMQQHIVPVRRSRLAYNHTHTHTSKILFLAWNNCINNILILYLCPINTLNRKITKTKVKYKVTLPPVRFTIILLFISFTTSAFPDSHSLSLSLLHCHPNTNPVQM